MGLNKTGKANTADYSLGRGTLYLAELVNGVPGDAGWRDLGNCPEFNTNLEVEELEHQSSRNGLRITDKSVVVSQEINLSFQLDEINFQNLALFFSGEASDSALVNPAIAGVTDEALIASAPDFSNLGGRWYDLEVSGVRVYDIDKANLSLESALGANTLVEGTDYEVDEKMGRVFILAGTTLVSPGDDVTFSLVADAGALNPDTVDALTQTNVTAALKFIGENPANNDKQVEYTFYQVQLKSDGDFSQIGDEFTQMGFTATAERNATLDRTLRIATHANA